MKQTLKQRLQRKWDWWIYRRAFHTFRRMALDNPGWSYLMELHLRGWNSEHPIPPDLKSATERFHKAMEETSERFAREWEGES